MVYKEITLDTWQQPLGEIRVIQEEADGRELMIHLFDNAAPLDLTGKTVSVYIQKPDNTIIYNACAVDGNTVTAVLTGQMMAAYGITKLCELQIIGADNHTLKVTLPPLHIVKSDYDGAIESTDEFSRLVEAINKVDTATEDAAEAATAANAAAQSADTAARTANTAANDANEAAQAAREAAQGFSIVTDPTTGLKATVQTALNNLYNYIVASIFSPITAQEYDALNLTAEAYDAQNITAEEYDTKARSILMGG